MKIILTVTLIWYLVISIVGICWNEHRIANVEIRLDALESQSEM